MLPNLAHFALKARRFFVCDSSALARYRLLCPKFGGSCPFRSGTSARQRRQPTSVDLGNQFRDRPSLGTRYFP
jgi:hypothetical protein